MAIGKEAKIMQSLKEAAISVINRRLNIDDILYFVRNMTAERYHYMMSNYEFIEGYREAVRAFIDITDQAKGYSGDEQIQRIINGVNAVAAQKIGDSRFSRVMDDYYTKGWAYAFQEYMQFLQGDLDYSDPRDVENYGNAV